MPVHVLRPKDCKNQELKSPTGAWDMPVPCLVVVDVGKGHAAS